MNRLLVRLGFYGIAAVASLSLNFLLPRLMPGDPATTLLARFRGQLDPEAIVALRETFGLSEGPLPAQYVAYLSRLARGDLGTSVSFFPAPVTSVLIDGLVWTLFLAGSTLVVSFALGSLLGLLAAWRRGSRFDTIFTAALTLVGAFTYFWLAMLLLYVFGFTLGWFPLRHAYADALSPAPTWSFIRSVVAHAFLPSLSIALATMGGWMLSMRNATITVLSEDYITLARAKGLTDRRIMFRYAARNALLPNVTSFGMALGFVLGGSLLTEIVFSYPGLGHLLLIAVRSQDYPLMQGLFLSLTFSILIANWAVDVVLALLDPRARTASAE
jgi:peptide/nickel transport system permease protein